MGAMQHLGQNTKSGDDPQDEAGFVETFRRFVPYLWPSDMPGLRWRIMLSMALVLASKGVGFLSALL